MRKVLLITLAFILFISCKNDSKNTIKFDWLAGSWERLNETDGKTTFEKWIPTIDGKRINGHGYTLQQNDTIFEEILVIKQKDLLSKNEDDLWILEVTGVNEKPTIFYIKECTHNSFTAVNLQNEFPTHIKYSRNKDTLNAEVYNDDYSIDFNFIKIK